MCLNCLGFGGGGIRGGSFAASLQSEGAGGLFIFVIPYEPPAFALSNFTSRSVSCFVANNFGHKNIMRVEIPELQVRKSGREWN